MEEAVKILIVEDEYITAKTLSNFLEASGYTVVGCAMDTEEALSYLKNTVIDCVVLDINLNDEKDGVWIANHIKENYQIPFIFLTAYTDKDTITRAVEASPFGFLAKPFQKVELFSAIEIALHKHNELTMFINDSTANEGILAKTVFLKNVDRFDKVAISDICFIESHKNYLLIHTNNMLYKHRATLKEFTEMLPQTDFVKTHRAFLINKDKITSVDKSNHIINVLHTSIPVSKAFRQEVYQKINLI